MVDLPTGIAGLLDEFDGEVRHVVAVLGLYVGGSLATGDYRPQVSDMDLVAVLGRPLHPEQRRRVAGMHRRFIARRPGAAKLHCVYVPLAGIDDVAARHVTWASRSLFDRPFTGIARAELLRYGRTVSGPAPDTLIPAVGADELRQAVRADLTRYWERALGWPWIWLRDFYIDLSLLTLARAEATLTDAELITKRAALDRLDRFGVPDTLTEQIRRRRDGYPTPLSPIARLRRALLVHALVSDGLRLLLSM